MKSSILSAYATSLLGVFSGLLTNLWLLREVTRQIEPGDFGVYAFVLQITSYLQVLQLGLDFAAARKIAEALGNGAREEANCAYWEVVRFNRKGAAVTAALVLLIAASLAKGFVPASVPSGSLPASVALLTGGLQVVSFLSRAQIAALMGNRHQHTVNLVTGGTTVTTTLLAYLLLRLGLGVLCLPVAALAVGVGAALVYSMKARSVCDWRTGKAPARSPSVLRSIAEFGGLTSLGGLAWTVEGSCDVMILGALVGKEAVAVYVLWWRFPSMLFDLCTRFTTSAFPSFAEQHGKSNADASALLSRVAMAISGPSTLAILGISLWLPSFMAHWLGSRYSVPDASSVALGMGCLVGMRTFGNLLGMFQLSSGQAGAIAALSVGQAVVKVVLALALVGPLGILGTVIASCAASLVQVVGSAAVLARHHPIRSGWAGKAVGLSGVAILLSVLGSRTERSASLLELVAGVAVTCAVWGTAWLVLAWHSELRGNLERLVRSRPHPSCR